MTTSNAPSTLVIDQTTVTSLFAALSLLIIAYVLSLRVLQPSTSTTLRVLFIWHLFDALIHFLFEGSFLYNCFFTYTTIPHTSDYPHPASLTAPGVYFLGQKDRLYGSAYGTSPPAMLWQEYAKADRRWGGSDLGVISLELLTVFGAGPLALVVCECVRRGKMEKGGWFWAIVLATGELYGGKSIFRLSSHPNFHGIYDRRRALLITLSCRFHDVCARMVDGKSEPGYQQLHVPVGIPRFLQYAMGILPVVGYVRGVWENPVGICERQQCCGQSG